MKIKLLSSAKSKIHKNKITKYHIFYNNDTHCKMWSSGGIKYEEMIEEVDQEYYKLLDSNCEICKMCSNKNKKYKYQNKANDKFNEQLAEQFAELGIKKY